MTRATKALKRAWRKAGRSRPLKVWARKLPEGVAWLERKAR